MIITAIEPRRKRLSQLYIDGECAMKLDTETLIVNKIKTGMEISDEELFELIQKSEVNRAREKALYLLERRSHAKKELIDKISRDNPRYAAEQAADKMEELGLIDDEEYGRRFAKDCFERKGFGKNRVKQELRLKGIDPYLIEELLEENEEDPVEKAREFLNKKYPLYKEDEKVKRRAVAGLQRMGYNWNEINSAMRDEY